MAIRMNDVWRQGLRYEPSERWIRAYKGGELVVDTRRPVVVWAEGRTVPQYAFPEEDVNGIEGEPFDDPDLAGFVAVAAGAIMPGVADSISTIFSKVASVMAQASTQGS